MNLQYTMQESWYYSAGERHGWAHEYGLEGFSLEERKLTSILEPGDLLRVVDPKGNIYQTTYERLKGFISKYPNSREKAKRGNVRLITFPRDLLTLIKRAYDPVFDAPDILNPQLSLI